MGGGGGMGGGEVGGGDPLEVQRHARQQRVERL